MSISISKTKFVLIVGDDGAVLTYVNGSKLENRLFAASPSLSDRREFNALLTRHPTVPIYMLLDTMEQSYTKQTLPAVSALSINKLVKKRLERDFAESDIKGAVHLGRSETGRKDWLYMFASTPVTATIADWIDYITSLPNKFSGIYMLPVEMETFMKRLNKVIFKEENKEKRANWQFLVTHDKTGGFRQVILHGQRVIFTRLIRPGKDTLPDIIAGNIEQEILNTTDYLRRLSFGDSENINVVAIVSKEIKKSLETSKIRGNKIILFTPFEVAEALGFEHVASPEDKFADLVLATNFASSKPVLKLYNPKTKKLNSLIMAYTWSSMTMMLTIPVFMIYSGVVAYGVMSTKKEIKNAENEKARIEKQWNDANSTSEYGIDEANKITDAVTLYNDLVNFTQSPLELITNMVKAQESFALVRSFNWTYDELAEARTFGKMHSLFNMDFYNTGDSLEELFLNFDTFTSRIKRTFNGYKVEHSKLPAKITFGDKAEIIEVQITIQTDDEKKGN